MEAWLAEARKIEEMECTARRGAAQARALAGQLEDLGERLDSSGSEAPAMEEATREELRTLVESILEELRPVYLGRRGDVRDPGHVNLPGRINWLTIQEGIIRAAQRRLRPPDRSLQPGTQRNTRKHWSRSWPGPLPS